MNENENLVFHCNEQWGCEILTKNQLCNENLKKKRWKILCKKKYLCVFENIKKDDSKQNENKNPIKQDMMIFRWTSHHTQIYEKNTAVLRP